MERSCQDTSTSTRKATQLADDGRKIVIDSCGVIGDIANEIQQAANAVSYLSNQTEEIGSILGVIRSIADQANLLGFKYRE